ncbi:MAG: hypothetical protein L6367_03885 [Cellulomonas sp.]|nr:hypothetical protein [Cellulomonas sp.]
MVEEVDQATASREAWQLAQIARQHAEAAHVEAKAAERVAVEHYASVKRRNDEGDETVSSLDLLTAQADLPRTRALAEARWRAVDEAQRVEAPLLARCVADQVEANADALSLCDVRKAQVSAANQISAALAPLVREVNRHAALYAEAAQMFEDAGVDRYNDYRRTPGGLTPIEADAWQPEPEYAQPLAISFGDIPTTTIGEAVKTTLAEALAVLGYQLAIASSYPPGIRVEVTELP